MKYQYGRLPFMGQKHRTAAELIIFLLAREWPLSLKGLFNRINGKYLKSISRQAVYKAAGELVSEEILIKNRRYYKLNSAWLDELKKFSSRVKNNYRLHATMLKDLP